MARQPQTPESFAASNPVEASVNPFAVYQNILTEMTRTTVIENNDLKLLIGSVILGEHTLLQGAPGIGKTQTSKNIAKAIGGSYGRIQGTPELTPADMLGSDIYNMQTREFEFMPGPIFNNIVLVDEINRELPKTQSALLEAMGEKQVTSRGTTHKLPESFAVVATENAHESGQGTSPLLMANRDRFAGSVLLQPLTASQMTQVVRMKRAGVSTETVSNTDELLVVRDLVKRAEIAQPLQDYVSNIVVSSRKAPKIDVERSVVDGARAALFINDLAGFVAFTEGKSTVERQHIDSVVGAVLRHRLGVTPDDLYAANGNEESMITEAIEASMHKAKKDTGVK